MKETKVYINKMPKWYSECPCNYDTYCQLHELNHYGEDNYHCKSCFDKRPKDCPLKSLHEHDKELVAKVLDKVKFLITKYDLLKNYNSCAGSFMLDKIIDQIQKEHEK